VRHGDPLTAAGTVAARRRVAAWRPHAAVVFGSGLESLPAGSSVAGEVTYEELGWPCTAVPGHGNRLRLVSLSTATGAELRLVLACGRPHGYEGWSRAELERPVRDLVAAGAGRVLLTNSCGALRPEVAPGAIVICTEVVDLQSIPAASPPRLAVCSAAEAAAVAASLAPAPSFQGTYVAVAGPQFETPAEVEWLAGCGAVVGMSAAPEVRAARGAGAGCCLLALVVNRAGAVSSHAEVLAGAGHLAISLSAILPGALQARWPELARPLQGGSSWIS
jgi:purine nucleoside phosphorylase